MNDEPLRRLPELLTDRLVLRPVTYPLAAAVLAGDLSAVLPAPGWPHADTRDALGPLVAAGDPRAESGWLITRADNGTVIGDCGWYGGPDPDGDAEIGYGLAAPSRGHGYGTEAVAALVGWVRDQPDVRRVVAGTLADNVPSRRLLERLGFSVDSVDGPTVRYALDAGTSTTGPPG